MPLVHHAEQRTRRTALEREAGLRRFPHDRASRCVHSHALMSDRLQEVDDRPDLHHVHRASVGNQEQPDGSPETPVCQVLAESSGEYRIDQVERRAESKELGTTHRVFDPQVVVRSEKDVLHLPGHADRQVERSKALAGRVGHEPAALRLGEAVVGRVPCGTEERRNGVPPEQVLSERADGAAPRRIRSGPARNRTRVRAGKPRQIEERLDAGVATVGERCTQNRGDLSRTPCSSSVNVARATDSDASREYASPMARSV